MISEGELVGIISERDYARRVILKGRSSKDTQVKEIMTSPVIHVTPHQTLDECMTIMTNQHVRHLPVMEGEHLLRRNLDWRPGKVDHHGAGRDHPTTGALHRWKFSILNAPSTEHCPDRGSRGVSCRRSFYDLAIGCIFRVRGCSGRRDSRSLLPVGPRHFEPATGEPYEGGIVSEGSARVRFSVALLPGGDVLRHFRSGSSLSVCLGRGGSRAGLGWLLGKLCCSSECLSRPLIYLWKVGALDWAREPHPTR